MQIAEIKDWLNTAKKGRRITYGQSDGFKYPDQNVMSFVYGLYKKGLVVLVQKRTGSIALKDNKFDYIMEKR